MKKKQVLPKKENISKAEKIVRKITNIFTTAVVVLVVIFALLIVGVRAFGIDVYIVLSPSMRDQYPPGSLIYITEVDPATLEVGDDITFRLSGDIPATHRIIEILYDETDPTKYSFRTQGTANDNPDANPVLPENVIGKALFAIPYLGYAVDFIQQPSGIYLCAAGAILIIILMLLPDVIFPKESEKKKKKKGAEECTGAEADPAAEGAPEAKSPAEAPEAPAPEQRETENADTPPDNP